MNRQGCTGLLVVLAVVAAAFPTYGIEKFMPRQGGDTELWRIVKDPVRRDWASYHIRNCWSSDGRYLAYEHYLPYRRYNQSRPEIRIQDFQQGKTVRIERAYDPRWANHRNWLFYIQWPAGDEGLHREIVWWDMERDRKVRLGVLATSLGTTDYRDEWLYANGVTLRDGRALGGGRMPIRPNPVPEALRVSGQLEANPFFPKVYTRVSNIFIGFRPTRVMFDPDGSHVAIASPCLQQCHQSWSGGGKYYLFGNQPMRGRLWNEPFPSNQHFLTNTRCGDICRCGKSDRWIAGSGCIGGLQVADLRSGDGRTYLRFALSYLQASPAFDYSYSSGLHDCDAKGSPDGTKICFVSNYDLKDGPITVISMAASRQTGPGLHVESTDGFPEQGRLACMNEVIGYSSKTKTTFLGLTRGMYGTTSNRMRRANAKVRDYLIEYPSDLRPGRPITMFEYRVIPKDLRKPDLVAPRFRGDNFGDRNSPLLWQRQTDVYVAVVRKPDRPWLRLGKGGVELIPGENHWETFGYHVLRDDEHVTREPVRPGATLRLPEAGAYTAIAVEYSALESLPSAVLRLPAGATLRAHKDKPEDFVWSSERWLIEGRPADAGKARVAREAVREIVHRYDGVIHREWYETGSIVRRHDLNHEGKATRRLWYESGRLARREHHESEGPMVTRELFDADGFVTEAIEYRKGALVNHWWYVKGTPVKLVTPRGRHHSASPKGGGTYMKQGHRWVKVE